MRKFLWEENVYDGSHDDIVLLAWYDKKGDLVYLSSNQSNHCAGCDEQYYVHKGCIVDFAAYYDCGCCDEEEVNLEEIVPIRPALGSPLERTTVWELPLEKFLKAETLQEVLKEELSEYVYLQKIETNAQFLHRFMAQ